MTLLREKLLAKNFKVVNFKKNMMELKKVDLLTSFILSGDMMRMRTSILPFYVSPDEFYRTLKR